MNSTVSRMYTYLFFLLILYPFIFLYFMSSQARVAGVDLITYIGEDIHRNIQFIISFILPFLGAYMWSLKDEIEARQNVAITFIKMMTIAVVLILLNHFGLALILFILIFFIYREIEGLFTQVKIEMKPNNLFTKEWLSVWALLGIGLIVRLFLINKV